MRDKWHKRSIGIKSGIEGEKSKEEDPPKSQIYDQNIW